MAPGSTTAPQLPFSLGNVEIYFDGDRGPLLMVSPTQVTAQVPWELAGANSTSVYLRTKHADGSVTVTNAIGLPLLDGAPGIFANQGNEPRVGQVYHGSSFATGIIVFNSATVQAGDVGLIVIGDHPYTYTVQATDSLFTIIQAFVNMINSDSEINVTASQLPTGNGLVVTSKVPGPAGNGIVLNASVTTAATNTGGALLVLTATNTVTCCASVVNRPVTALNPAVPGETVFFIATGLGLVCTPADLTFNVNAGNCSSPDAAKDALITGSAYNGPWDSAPLINLNVTVQGGSATIVSAGIIPGTVGLYQVVIQLPNTLTANPFTQLFIQQLFNSSNIVTLPVGSPLQFQ